MYGCSFRLLYREIINLERKKNQTSQLLASFIKPHNAVAKSQSWVGSNKYWLCLELILTFLNHILPVPHPQHMQGPLVYHYEISLKVDLGPIKLHGRGFTTNLSLYLKKKFRKLLWNRKALKREGWGSGLQFYIAMTLREYNIRSKQILLNKIQKLHKARKWLQCNWDFMNKIEVKI